MPVERYQSIQEMNAAPIRAGAEDAFARFVRHCARYRQIARHRNPVGVFRFRSIEEAQAGRESAAAHSA